MAVLRDSADHGRDDVIQSSNVGGLNTMASPLNAPYGSSPDTLNTALTPGGNVQKRRGTSIAFDTRPGKVYAHPITTRLGYTYTILAGEGTKTTAGKGIEIFELDPTAFGTPILIKENVYPDSLTDWSVQFTDLEYGRILLLNGQTVPIELRYHEFRYINDDGTLESTTTYELPVEWDNATSADTLVYVDGVYQAPSSYTLSATGWSPNSTIPGTNVDFVRFVWGWWCEAYIYWGDRFWFAVPRFSVYESDRHVPIPEKVRDGVFMTSSQEFGAGFEITYATNDNNLAYTFNYLVPDGTPGGTHVLPLADIEYEYVYSDGTDGFQYSFMGNTATTHICFGDLPNLETGDHQTYKTTENAVNVYFGRIRLLQFFGDNIVAGSRIHCRLKQSQRKVSHNTDGVGQHAYILLTYDRTTNNLTENEFKTTGGNAIGFYKRPNGVQTSGKGVPFNEQVQIVCTRTEDGLLNKNLTSLDDLEIWELQTPLPTDGFNIPIYGLSLFCDYKQGVFPYTASITNNRLVLAGFSSDPLRVIMSAPDDTYVAGERFTYFQVDPFNSPETAPQDFLMDSERGSDVIRQVVSWQGSLWVFSRSAVWRLKPSEGGYTIQQVAPFGITDGDCVAVGRNKLFFATIEGVYEVTPSEGFSDTYQTIETSLPIRDIFRDFVPTTMVYDTKESRLHVAGQDSTNDEQSKTLVYYPEVDGWSQWEYAGRPRVVGMFTSEDTSSNNRSGCFVEYDGGQCYALLHDAYTLDQNEIVYVFTDVVNHGDSSWTVPDGDDVSSTFTFATGTTYYRHTVASIGDPSIDDLIIYDANTLETLTWGLDYVSDGHDGIRTLRAIDEVEWTVTPKYPAPLSSAFLPLSDDLGRSGLVYPAHWSSIEFTAGLLDAYKRHTHLNLFFDFRTSGGRKTTGDGQLRNGLSAFVSFLFGGGQAGDSTSDLYSLLDATWDTSFLTYGDWTQEKEYLLLREAIQGIGYSFRFRVWNYDTKTWALAGFQIDGQMKGKRFRAR